MSDERRPKKRRKSAAQLFLGMIGFGGGDDKEATDPPAEPHTTDGQRPDKTAGQLTGAAASSAADAASIPSPAAASPARVHSSEQNVIDAARSALRALTDSDTPPVRPLIRAGGKGKGKGKGRGKGKGKRRTRQEAEEEEEEEEEEREEDADDEEGGGHAMFDRQKAGSTNMLDDADEWTEDEALNSLQYDGKALSGMLVAELRDALAELDLDSTGRQPELRVRLGRRICSDIIAGTTGAAAMTGYGLPGVAGDADKLSEAPSARNARHQRRRTSLAVTSLRKGPETKDSPIMISSSDDEREAAAAAAAVSQTASSNAGRSSSGPAVTSVKDGGARAQGRLGKRTRAVRDAEEPIAETEVTDDAEALDAAPKSGMTVAELRKKVKALGLKPKGTRKADLEACWQDAMKKTAGEEHLKSRKKGASVRHEGGNRSENASSKDSEQIKIGGVRVLDMKVVTLRKHVHDMGLKPSGHLKADLQQCLCDALRGGHSGRGKHAPNRLTPERTSAATDKSEASTAGERRRVDRPHHAGTPAARGRRATTPRAEDGDTSERSLSPDRVRFHGENVSEMKPEERRQTLHDLDMASLRKDDDEITHDLVDGLVQRKAEAADPNPRKQAWCGRPVYMMRKAELGDMLRHFNADDTGKVEDMRARFRQELRKWASSEIDVDVDGDGDDDGAGEGSGEEGDAGSHGATTGDTSAEVSPGGKSRGHSSTARHSEAKGAAGGVPHPRGRGWTGTQSKQEETEEDEEVATKTSGRRMVAGKAPKAAAQGKTRVSKTGDASSGSGPSEGAKKASVSAKRRAAADDEDASDDVSSSGDTGRRQGGRPPRADQTKGTRRKGKAKGAETKVDATKVPSTPSAAGRHVRKAADVSAPPRHSEEDESGEDKASSSRVRTSRRKGKAASPSPGEQENERPPSTVAMEDTEESEVSKKQGSPVTPARRRVESRVQAMPASSPAEDERDVGQVEGGEPAPESAGASLDNKRTKAPNTEGGDDGDRDDGGDDGGGGGSGRGGGGARRDGSGSVGSSGGAGGDDDDESDSGRSGSDRDSESEEANVEDKNRDEDEDEDEDDDGQVSEMRDDQARADGNAAETPDTAARPSALCRTDSAEFSSSPRSDLGTGGDRMDAMLVDGRDSGDSGDNAAGAHVEAADVEMKDALVSAAEALETVRGDLGPAERAEHTVDLGPGETTGEENAGEGRTDEGVSEENDTAGSVAERATHFSNVAQGEGETIGEGDTEEEIGDEAQEVGAQEVPQSDETDSVLSGREATGDGVREGLRAEPGGDDEGDGDGGDEALSEGGNEFAIGAIGEIGAASRHGEEGQDVLAEGEAEGDQESTDVEDEVDNDKRTSADLLGASPRSDVDDDLAPAKVAGEGLPANDGGGDEDGSRDGSEDGSEGGSYGEEGGKTGMSVEGHADSVVDWEQDDVEDVENVVEEVVEEADSTEVSMALVDSHEAASDIGDQNSGSVEDTGREEDDEQDDQDDQEEGLDEGEEGLEEEEERLKEEEEGLEGEEEGLEEEEEGLQDEEEGLKEEEEGLEAGDEGSEEEEEGLEEGLEEELEEEEQGLEEEEEEEVMEEEREGGQTTDGDKSDDGVEMLLSPSPHQEQEEYEELPREDAPDLPAGDLALGQDGVHDTGFALPERGPKELVSDLAANGWVEDVENHNDEEDATLQETLEDAGIVYASTDDPRQAASRAQVSSGGDDSPVEPQFATYDRAMTGVEGDGALIDPKEGMDEVRALLRKVGYVGKREGIEFLADPAVRPVDISLPYLTPEEEARLRGMGRSVCDWDEDLILMLNNFLESARHLHPSAAKEKGTCEGAWPVPRNGEGPNVRDVVPSMRRKMGSKDSQRPAAREQHSPPRGVSGSAFATYTAGRRKHSSDTEGSNGARMGSGYDDGELTPKRRRVDETGRAACPPVSSFGSTPTVASTVASAADDGRPGGASLTLAAMDTPGRPPSGAGVAGSSVMSAVALRDRRRSNGSVLRYRSRDFTPGKKRRPSVVVDERRDAGTLGEYLGEAGGAKDSPRAAPGRRGEGARRRAEGQRSTPPKSLQDGRDGGLGAPGSSKRDTPPLGLEGMDATKRRRSVEETSKAASKMAAASKATSEVGSILMSLVSQQVAASGVKQTVRDEHALRSKRDEQRETKRGKMLATQEQTSGKHPPASVVMPQPTLPGQGSEFVFRVAPPTARLQQLDTAMDTGAGALTVNNDSDAAGEFSFGTEPSRSSSIRRAQPFSFARAIPAKRSRSRRDEESDALLVSSNSDEERHVSPETFQFSVGRRQQYEARVSRRRLAGNRKGLCVSGAAHTGAQSDAPATGVPPLAVAGASGNASVSSSGPAARVPVTNGFDMSKFSKPGEWKCESCLVRNPPGGNKCLSCEVPKPGGAEGASGGSTEAVGGGGALSLSSSSSGSKFTFGAQPSGNASGRGGINDAATTSVAVAIGGGASSASPPMTGGFDMSKFSKPGEWKCDSCLVKNPMESSKCLSCETPKPGSGGKAAATPSGGLFGGTGAAPASNFTFGTPATAKHPTDTASASSSGQGFSTSGTSAKGTSPAFTFGAQTSTFGAGGSATPAFSGKSAPAAAPQEGGFDMSKFSKPGEWKCESCLVRNSQQDIKCVSCATPKTGAEAESVTDPVSAGPVATGGSAFTFGAVTLPSAGTPSTGAALVTGGGAEFRFGAIASAAPAGPVTTAPAGGAVGAEFTFGAAPAAPAVVSASSPPQSGNPTPPSDGPGFSLPASSSTSLSGASAPSPLGASFTTSGRASLLNGPTPSVFGSQAPSSLAFGSTSGAGGSSASVLGGSAFGAPAPGAAPVVPPPPTTFGGSLSNAPSVSAGSLFGTASTLTGAPGSGDVRVQVSTAAAPMFSFGAGSLPAPAGGSNTGSTSARGSPLFRFGAGSLPAPANLAAGNASGSLFTFGGASGASATPASVPATMIGSTSPASIPPSSSTASRSAPRFTFGQNPPGN